MTGPILALDLATRDCGWCLYAAPDNWQAGTWALGRDAQQARLIRLGGLLAGMIRDQRPGLVVAEVPNHAKHSMNNSPQAIQALATAWGVVIEAARAHGVPSRCWTPQLVRERLTGCSVAGKEEAQRHLLWRGYMLPRLPGGEVDHDAADALALAVVQMDQLEYDRRLGKPA